MFLPWKRFRIVCLAGIAGLALTWSSAVAGTTVKSLGGGWVATWDDSQDVDLIVTNSSQTADALILKKVAFFTKQDGFGGVSPIVISSLRQSPTAPQFLVIDEEVVHNQTGLDWIGFQFAIEPSSTQAAFDTGATDVSPPGSGFSISPFTNAVFSDDNRVLTLSGGTVLSAPALPSEFTPGIASGALVIDTRANLANRLTDFVFEEQPIIPLPAAAWMGLSGLVGLGVIGYRKSVKSLLA
jgi:hypothetical protein